MSYHINEIPKGVVGEFSKIEEEFLELKDGYEQKDKILQLVELSDLIGAIECYLEKNFYETISVKDLISFSNKTRSAFKEGIRTNKKVMVENYQETNFLYGGPAVTYTTSTPKVPGLSG